VAFSYDGALPTAVRWAGTVNGSVEVGYRNDFRIVSQTVNGVDAVSFAFDRDGLLTRAGGLTLSRNATNGLLVADTLGSIASAYRHTSRGELESSRVTGKETTFLARTYARDSTGRISQLDDTTLGTATHWSFVYDSIGRLVADSVNGAPFHAFTYDANGNRLSYTSQSGTVAYSYDAQDRLLSAGSATYTYRSNGELQTKSISGAGTTTYTYDALGNLVTVVLPSGTRIDYVIDGQNRRVGRKVNGVLVKGWLYQNQLNPVAELDGSGNIVSRFVYGSRMNVPAYMERNGVVYRIISDQLGSVRLVVDTATNTITQRIDYDEWGNIILNTNPGFQSFGFAGGILDDSTTLVRFGFRDYDASTGRWTAKDLIGFAGSETDLYAYALNSPLNAIDPQGLQVVCEWEQWSGHLTCDNWTTGEDGVIDTYGYAGKDYGWNNPFAQDVKNTGPIPEGLYDIGAPDWGTQGLGNPAFRLTPWPGNEMFGRGDFWLHADNPKTLGQSSKGCPIVGLGARKTLADELKKAGGIGILDVLQGPWSR